SKVMRRLMTGYAVTFNKRHKRSGHLQDAKEAKIRKGSYRVGCGFINTIFHLEHIEHTVIRC
ncbi:MAG: hypothetical protein DRH50_12340, partial [Deltaproteobacteria bacterium]